jgi:SAM-dependent methyltransferase
MERDHWDELFDELYLKTYARFERGGAEESREEALAAVRLSDCPEGGDVLDAPCGYGRHSIPLAAAGYRVIGVDRSQMLLDEARRRAGETEWPRFVRADHRNLPFADASFDAVLCLFTSLGYRGEEGDRRTLGQFRRVLRAGARLVVETMHRDRLVTIFQPRSWDPLPDGGLVIEERRFDHAAGEVQTSHVLVPADGSRKSVTYRVRTYTATELAALAHESGFTDVECYGDLNGGELSTESRLVLAARVPS